MRRTISFIIVLTLGVAFCLNQASADQVTKDLSASVIVRSTFHISLDRSVIDFGFIKPGELKHLGEGSFYNQVTCQSNTGNTWHLKVQATREPQLLGKVSTISLRNLKWMAGWTNGSGSVVNQYRFNDFDLKPALVYTSAGSDNTGEEVKIQFQYGLDVPGDAMAGTYTTEVSFIMTEMP